MTATAEQRCLRHVDADPRRARTLSAAQIEGFNRDGFIAPLPLLSPGEATEQRRVFDELLRRASAEGLDSYGINGWHDRSSAIWDLAMDRRLVDRVVDLLGNDVVVWGSHYFAKLPGDGKAVTWHQDAPYWPLTPSRTVTAWIAIDDADVGNGAMEVVPGSHRLGALDHRQSAPDERNVLWLTLEDRRLATCAPPRPVELRAGDCSLHSDLLVHGSPPNPSPTRRRCGLTLRYAHASVRAFNGPWRVVVCRGDHGPNWRPLLRPS